MHLSIRLLFIFLVCQQSQLLSEEEYREITRQSYDLTAQEYQKNVIHSSPESRAKEFLACLGPNAILLDLGCGPGVDAKYFSENGYQVVAVDISPQMIELARASVPSAQFFIQDIETIEFEAESFDGIWASASLLHVSKEKLPKVLEDLLRLLKPGGYFYLCMKKGSGESFTSDSRYGGVTKFWNYVDEEELINLLQAAGFTLIALDVKEVTGSYQTHPWISVLSKKI